MRAATMHKCFDAVAVQSLCDAAGSLPPPHTSVMPTDGEVHGGKELERGGGGEREREEGRKEREGLAEGEEAGEGEKEMGAGVEDEDGDVRVLMRCHLQDAEECIQKAVRKVRSTRDAAQYSTELSSLKSVLLICTGRD